MTRRTVLGMLVAGGTMLISGIVAIPTFLAGVSPALRSRRSEWRSVGPAEGISVGEVRQTFAAHDPDAWPKSTTNDAVFVWRKSDTEFVVFSRSCTDLGCPLDYEPGSACYFCPCHGGIFANDGSRLAGPPNGPMHRYVHRIRNDLLEIDLSSVPAAV
jgi:menaquinol-cytochrome c reductase iron-sulfur subunit